MRSALTLLALTTAIAAVVSLLGISTGFTRSFADIYEAHAIDIVVSRQGSADRLSSSIDQVYAKRIEGEIAGVDRAAAVLLETLSLEEEGLYGIPTQGIANDSWLLNDYHISDQIDIKPDRNDSPEGTGVNSKSQEKTVLLGVHLADRLGVSAGARVDIFGEPHRIRGVFRSPSTWENGSMILPIAGLQRLVDRPGQATYINVVLEPGLSASEAQTAIQQIQAMDAKLLALPTKEFVETDTRMQLAGAMAWMTSVIALVIGSIGTLNTMLTSVMERTQEIGILRAIGWPKRRVIGMILLESLGLAVLASGIGTVLALLLTWGLSQAPAAKGILSPSIEWPVILQGFLLAVGIGLLGAILPALRAARMMPTEAFRSHA